MWHAYWSVPFGIASPQGSFSIFLFCFFFFLVFFLLLFMLLFYVAFFVAFFVCCAVVVQLRSTSEGSGIDRSPPYNATLY